MSTCPLHEKAKMLYHQRFFWSLWLMQLICFDAVEPPDSSPEFQLRRSQRWVPMKIGRPPSLVAPGKSALVKKTLGQGVSLDFIKQTKINQLYIGSFRWKTCYTGTDLHSGPIEHGVLVISRSILVKSLAIPMVLGCLRL